MAGTKGRYPEAFVGSGIHGAISGSGERHFLVSSRIALADKSATANRVALARRDKCPLSESDR